MSVYALTRHAVFRNREAAEERTAKKMLADEFERIVCGDKVYFAKAGDLVKIGMSSQVPQRMKELSRDTGCYVRVLAIEDGAGTKERALHHRFGHARARGREWFRGDDPELLAYISELQTTPEGAWLIEYGFALAIAHRVG